MATKTVKPVPGEFVTELHIVRQAEFGGFNAALCEEGMGTILLSAKSWKGTQPRLTLERFSPGYQDWLKILEATPEISIKLQFVGDPTASHHQFDQWLTHRPSALMGQEDGHNVRFRFEES